MNEYTIQATLRDGEIFYVRFTAQDEKQALQMFYITAPYFGDGVVPTIFATIPWF